MRSCSPVIVAGAYATDLLLGDPPNLPHPVRLMGWFINRVQNLLKPPRSAVIDLWSGAMLATTLTFGSWYVCRFISRRATAFHPAAGILIDVTLGWTTLATKSLLNEAQAVLDAMERNDLDQARRTLSRIVGRDTEQLSEQEIARAAIETLAESLCDGVVAPLLYLAIAGVPGAMAYKAVNTLDSMIGHREQPYTYFGRFSARADDLLNLLPARLTALLISVLACRNHRSALRTWRQDGHKHPSPNAGQSEAAMAGALGVRLGGTSFYDGKASHKPLLGSRFAVPKRRHIRRALEIAERVSLLMFVLTMSWCLAKRQV